MEIGGETTARVFKYLQKNDHATQADLEDFADTRMNIIDEISFANLDVMTKISANLKMFTECQEFQYGRIPICFWVISVNLNQLRSNAFTPIPVACTGIRH